MNLLFNLFNLFRLVLQLLHQILYSTTIILHLLFNHQVLLQDLIRLLCITSNVSQPSCILDFLSRILVHFFENITICWVLHGIFGGVCFKPFVLKFRPYLWFYWFCFVHVTTQASFCYILVRLLFRSWSPIHFENLRVIHILKSSTFDRLDLLYNLTLSIGLSYTETIAELIEFGRVSF